MARPASATACFAIIRPSPSPSQPMLVIVLRGPSDRCPPFGRLFKSAGRLGLCYSDQVRQEASAKRFIRCRFIRLPCRLTSTIMARQHIEHHVMDETHTYGREATRRVGDHPANLQ
jgi:hypothetical protein